MALIFALGALLALAAPADAAVAGHSLRSQRAFLAAGMQPEVVARTLIKVEQEWKAEAGIFVECSSAGEGGDSVADCNDAPKSFTRSCTTVVSAMVQGSGGDKDTVKEYMEDVCGQNSLSGRQKDGCVDLGAAIEKSMTADNYENRNNFDASPPCSSIWSRLLETEKARAAEEEAERKEAEKKAAEEAAEAAKKAKEQAEAEAKAKAERQKAEALRKKAEEADRKKKEAEEAASRVAEAAKRVAEKKAEAEAAAKNAREKMEEAAKVEQEHHDLLVKANVTPAAVPTQPAKANVSTPEPENVSTPVPAPGNITVNVTARAAAKKVNTTLN